ncbi:TPA: hypothetical protein HA265_05780, partial [Candidatus Woesearchaeota archaeon]|nr:hypothetical protein [Candidatus Woesearchaeota archaeon]
AVNTTLCNGTYYWTPESNADYLFTLGANDVIVAGNNTRIVSTINTWGSFLFAANYHRLTVHDVEGWNLSNVVLYQGSDYGRAYNIKSNRSNAVRINGGTDHGLFWNITAYNSDALFGTGAITNNTLFNFRTNAGGVYFSSATGKSTVRDGLINDSSYGIYLFAADNMVFQNLSVNCLGANSAAYLWSGSDNNNFTNNTFYNCNRGVHITSGTGNKFYYNNFSNNALYHADAVAGNHFNWTVGGVAHGNYWDDLDTLRIFDSDGDGFGDFGADYPYNSANGGHVTANVNDWGPITDKACYDNDLDTFYSTNSHPDCPEFKDCNDNNASIMPPKDNLVVNKNITLCNGTYYINDSISSGVIQITANDVILKGNNTLIVGNGTAFSSGYGIFVNSIHRVTVQDVNVSNYSYGIYNQYANGMTIRNYTASDVGYSVYLYLVNGAAIDDIRVSDTAYWPMYFALGDNLTLTDSIFQHSGAYANLQINGAVENPCINITMNNLTLHDGGYGLELNRVYNSTFSDLNVTNQSNWHIALARVNDSRFSDISLKSQGGGGVYVSDSESNLFNNITCQDLSVGASFNQNSYHNNFTNSTFLDSISYGIEIPPSGSTDNRFYYNQFINSGTYHAMVQVAGNHFNTTDSVTGWAEGNFWDDISSLDIVDANNDGYGDTGTDYPYNSSNGGKVTTLVTDWGPIVPPESYDNITGGERYWIVETDVDMRVWTEVPNWATMYYCNASIYSPLCSIFISENTNDTVLTFNGTSNGVNQTMVRYYHVNTVPLTESPIKTQQINIVYGSYIQNSSLWNTTVENSSYIIHSDINHSVIGGCYIENSIIRNSTILELSSAKNPCRIINSTIDDSTIYSSRIYNSVIDPTTIIDSIVINSTCTDCYIEYSEIANTNFCGPFNLFAAIVTETILSGGRATYSGTNYYPVVSTDSICTFLPSVVITNPTPGSVVNGTFYINFTSTENRSLQLSIDGGTWTGLASNTSFIADSTTIQDGAHTVQIRDVDAAGHYVYSNVVTYIVDNTPDFVTILRPEAGDVLVGNVTAEVLAADYIKRVEYFLQNTTGIYSLAGAAGTKSQDTDSSDGWIQLIQSGNLGEGSYNLTVEAYERCYFVTDCFVANKTIGPLYIDRTAPTGSLTIIGTNGNTTDTIYRDVMLNVTFNDTMEVDKCRYANDAASNLLSAVWEPCTTMKAWVLSEGQGTKTVFYEIKDTSGNNQTYSDTINFYYAPDPTPPTPPIVYDGLSPSVDIDWSNSADTLSANWFGATEDFTEIYYRYRILENGSYYNNDGNWTEAGTATSFTNDTLTLLEGSNYSVEVIAYNTFGLNATAVVSDGVVIDLTEPRKPTVTSPTHPVQGQAYPESSATFHFNSSDINSSGVLSGIEGYSWKLDDWPGSAPDDIIDGRTYQELAELVTGQEELVLKINGSAAADHAFAVWKEVAGDLVANQTLRIRFALAEKVEDTRQLMNYVVAISDDGNAPYGTNPTDLLAPVQVFEKDIKYAYTMDHAYVYETTFTVNDSVTDGSFFIALGGWASDDDNLNNLSLSATDDPALVDNTTTNYVCEETVGSCVENANIEYAIGVDLMDSLNETYTVNYDLLGDGTYYFHVKAKDNAGNGGNTTHYKFVVATGGVSVSISEPVDNQMFLSPSLTYNVSVNVFVSDNASVFVTAVHPDGSSYNSTKRDIQTSGRFNVTIERGTNEIYANANSTNGVASRSSSVYVILSEEAQPATNKTLRVRYASCSNTDSNICWTNDLGGGTIAGIAAEKATVAAGELQSETIYDGIKIFATDSGGFDSTDINNMLVQNSFLDQKNPFFGLSRKISEYMVRNELRYQDLSLGGRFRLSPGTYRVYLRHNGVTADGRVNVTVVIE